MGPSYAPREFGAIIRGMAETGGDITGNDDAISLRDFLRGHFDHLDTQLHEVAQRAERIEKHLETIVADLDGARPLLDKWKRSGIARLVGGKAPWG